jgi:hypothetical protein
MHNQNASWDCALGAIRVVRLGYGWKFTAPRIFRATYEFRRQRPLPSWEWALTQTPETGQKITRDHYVRYSI